METGTQGESDSDCAASNRKATTISGISSQRSDHNSVFSVMSPSPTINQNISHMTITIKANSTTHFLAALLLNINLLVH